MIDQVKFFIKAGDGGNGSVSFYKLVNMRYGKPDGGDGGNGGSVFLEATNELFDLESYRGKNLWTAKVGQNGGKNQKKGADGVDLVLKVPVGTVVNLFYTKKFTYFDKKNFSRTYETKNNPVYRFDLATLGDKILCARGGKGGRGNMHATKQRDLKGKKANHWDNFNRAEKGFFGEEAEIILELKSIAQVGLIGLPNAGKSSLLQRLTNAHPKIADYPFTTLEPNLGVIKNIIIADIPGIISGASVGKGLGLTFLRHIERTSLLFHVLDGNGSVKENYQVVRDELKYYGHNLNKKKEVIVVNKTDLLTKEDLIKIKKVFMRKKLFFISCLTGQGIDELGKYILKSEVH